jgi:hypothetical protein
MNKELKNHIINTVIDTVRKLDLDAVSQRYWIRDFEIASNDAPFQYQNLSFIQLESVISEFFSNDYIRIGLESDASIVFDYYTEQEKNTKKIPELSPAEKFELFNNAWTRVSARLDNMIASGHNLDLLHQIEALLDKNKEDKLDLDADKKTIKVFHHKELRA